MWHSADTKCSYPPLYEPTYCSTALHNLHPDIGHLKLKVGVPATAAMRNVYTDRGFSTLFCLS